MGVQKESRWGMLGWVVASAVMLGLVYPQVGWWWLGYVGLVPMGWVWVREESVKRLWWMSWVVMSVWWLWMIRWMWPVTGGGYVALSGWVAVYGVVGMWMMRVLHRRMGLPVMLGMAMGWVSMELLRGHWPVGGLSWYSLGQSQAPWRVGQGGWVIQIAEWVGEDGVSFFVAMTNGLIVDLMLAYKRWQGREEKTGNVMGWVGKRVGGQVMVWVVVAVGIGFYGWKAEGRYGYLAEGQSDRVRVMVVQTNVPQNNKVHPTAETQKRDWNQLVALTRSGVGNKAVEAHGGVDLVVWPETMVPGALDGDSLKYDRSEEAGGMGSDVYDRQIRELAKEIGVGILAGAHWNDWEEFTGEDGLRYVRVVRSYNAAVLYDRWGTQRGMYAKRHRVPFGEYIPWVEEWPWAKKQLIRWMTPYDFDYTLAAGKAYTLFEVGGGGMGDKAVNGEASGGMGGGTGGGISGEISGGISGGVFAAPICFEDTVGRVCREMVYGKGGKKRVDFLVNLTNDGWFVGSNEPWQHMQQAVIRCVELRVPMARAVNTGVSGWIGADGRVMGLVMQDGKATEVEGTAIGELKLRRDAVTWYGKWGQLPMWAVAVVTWTVVGWVVMNGVMKDRREREKTSR